MEKTKVTRKEFETLLKEIDYVDVKDRGYAIILLAIANDLYSDLKMCKEMGLEESYKNTNKQINAVQDLLKSHGYLQ